MIDTIIKRRLKMLILGVFLVVLIAGSGLFIMGRIYNRVVLPNRPVEKSIRVFEQQMANIEILFLGASGISRGVDPDLFTRRSFNLAHPGENYIITYLKLRTFIDSMPHLKMVVVPVSYGNFSSALLHRAKVYESTLTRDREFFNSLPLTKVPRERWSNRRFGVIPQVAASQLKKNTYWALRELSPGRTTLFLDLGLAKASPMNPRTGYSFSKGSTVTESGSLKTVNYFFTNGRPLDPDLLSYFKKLIDLCYRHHILVVTVATPLTDIFIQQATRHLTSDVLYQATIRDPTIAPRIKAHFDYTYLFPATYTYFKDANHVNQKGALVLSRILANEIENLF